MSSAALTVVPKTYAELRTAVVAVVVKGRAAIDRAWVESYHETGRLIHEHVLLKMERADYGAGVISRLAADTEVSGRTLRECLQFYRCFPIVRLVAKLGWNRGRLLSQVANATERKALLAEALKHDWSTNEIVARVRLLNAGQNSENPEDAPVVPSSELLMPRRGTPGLHLIVDRGDGPVVDLGFKLYRGLGEGAARLRPYAVGDIVRLTGDGVQRVADATKAELFTYAATIKRVIDGDTLVVWVTLAPGWRHELKLRLRGLDCPEISTAAGRAAKRFVDGLIKPGDEVIVSTSKPDKYDRYLADVFIHQGSEGEGREARGEGMQPEIFLNNTLLGGGYAVRYDGGAKE